MTEEQFEKARGTVRDQMTSALERSSSLIHELDAALQPLDAADDEARATLEQMDRASAKAPFGLLAYRYAKGMANARGPVVYRDGSLSDEYEELSKEEFTRLKEQFANPAIAARAAVYERAQSLLNDVHSQALTLRHFTGSEPLLDRFATVLQPPWFERARTDDISPRGPWALHWAYATLPFRELPHVAIIAERRAAIGTLHLLLSKLRALRALLETVLLELDFATPRTEPAPVPATWNDNSIHFGNNAAVEGSAIGSGSNVETA